VREQIAEGLRIGVEVSRTARRARRRRAGTIGRMCRAVTCARCGRAAWAGCGKHVEQVLGDVPKSQRCQCDADAPAGRQPKRGLLSRVFGRGGSGGSSF
jgi:hypothetical protein